MKRTLSLPTILASLLLTSGAVLAGDPPPPAGPAVPAPGPVAPAPAPAPAPLAPAPAPAPAPGADDPYVAGERAVDEAMRWIAKGDQPVSALSTLHADIDYRYDDGSTRDERRMELWFRNPDAFRANFQYGGRDSSFLLVGQRGFMIRDRIRVTDLNNSPTMKEVLPMLQNYRAVLQEVGRLMAPKSPGARFRLEGIERNPQATGGQWFKVIRTAPREPMMSYFFGAAPRRDGAGMRAIAPDRLIIHGEPGTNYVGDEYRLFDWARDDAVAQREAIRYPKRIQLYAIGIDVEGKPTMNAVVNSIELNQYIDPSLLTPPF